MPTIGPYLSIITKCGPGLEQCKLSIQCQTDPDCEQFFVSGKNDIINIAPRLHGSYVWMNFSYDIVASENFIFDLKRMSAHWAPDIILCRARCKNYVFPRKLDFHIPLLTSNLILTQPLFEKFIKEDFQKEPLFSQKGVYVSTWDYVAFNRCKGNLRK